MTAPASATAIGAAVEAALPTAAPVSVHGRVEIGWGNENWRAGSALGPLMVKVGPPGTAPEKWRATQRARDLARDAGLPVSEQLAFVDAARELDGRLLRVFRFIEGRSPLEIVDDPARRDRFFEQLGRAVATLHQIRLPAFTSRIGGDRSFARWRDYVAYRWLQVAARAAGVGVSDALVERAGAQLLAEVEAVDGVVSPSVTHRDLSLDNLLADAAGNLVAILDFDTAEAWDPVADFHKLRWWVFERHAGTEASFLAGYRAGGEPAPLFEERLRVVELLELVNGIANWMPSGNRDLTDGAVRRLDRILERV